MSIEELEILNQPIKEGSSQKLQPKQAQYIAIAQEGGVFVSNEKEIYKLADASGTVEKAEPELQRAQPVRSRLSGQEIT